jgi:hypothetical protein
LSVFLFQSLENLKELYLAGNNLRKLDPCIFRSTAQLEIVDLSNNGIYNLDKELLKYLKGLILIDLSHNLLRGLDNDFFEYSTELTSLDLSYNNLHILSADAFENNDWLLAINCNSNMLSTLNGSLARIHSLNKIDLSNNPIKSLSSQFPSQSDHYNFQFYARNTSADLVETFSSGNNIFKAISSLDLSFNDLIYNRIIYKFPFKEYRDSLFNLILYRCNLNGVDVAILNLFPLLEEINLSENMINLSSQFMSKSINLKRISLSHCGFTKLDSFLISVVIS